MNFAGTMRRIAPEMLRYFARGRQGTLRRYAETTSPKTGSASKSVAETLTGLCVELKLTREQEMQYRESVRRFVLEGVTAAGQALAGNWTFDAGSGELAVVGKPRVSQPDGAAPIFWEVLVRE